MTAGSLLHGDLRLQCIWNEVIRDILQVRLRSNQSLGDGMLEHLRLLGVIFEVHLQLGTVKCFTAKFHHTRVLDELLVDAAFDVVYTRSDGDLI